MQQFMEITFLILNAGNFIESNHGLLSSIYVGFLFPVFLNCIEISGSLLHVKQNFHKNKQRYKNVTFYSFVQVCFIELLK